jgi:hypothetical protein
VDLRDSHFISSGFYKLARDGTRANPNPVLVSESVSIVSSDQATDYLLCTECEGRFNAGGEDWILKNCWHSESEFMLRAALLATTPSPLSTPGFTIFEGVAAAANEPDKLAYFAASIFWRGAAHDWIFMRQKPNVLDSVRMRNNCDRTSWEPASSPKTRCSSWLSQAAWNGCETC